MDFEIRKDIDECKALWDSFSPNERLFDIWDYRSCFFDEKEHEPYFIVGYDKSGIEGFIPLVFNKKSNKYDYFGGWFAEKNGLYIKDKAKLKLFLEQCPDNTSIEGLNPTERGNFGFLEDQYSYYLDLSRYDYSLEKYFSSLNKKRQKNLRSEFKKIPEYKVHLNRIKDYKRFVELNIMRHNGQSQFNDKTVRKGFLKMVKLANEKGTLDMMSVEINNKVEAVDICVLFKNRYYALIGSSNCQKISNLGKLMVMLNIKNAIEKGAKYVEFGATADHWKHMWEFDKDMLLKFVK